MKKSGSDPDPRITRRDFVNGLSVVAGAALLSRTAPGFAQAERALRPSIDAGWYGYGGVGDYKESHGNTPEAVANAHRIRDGEFDALLSSPVDGEEYDLVIVGCGMAGLGAALEYMKRRNTGQTCLMLDNHPVFGGEAKENEFHVDGTTLFGPQGANGFFVPPRVDDYRSASGDARYYAELGIPRELPYQSLDNAARVLNFCQDNYGYLVRGLQDRISTGHFFSGKDKGEGQWAVDMWRHELRNAPLPEARRKALMNWYECGAARSFETDDAAKRYLDQMSYREFLVHELGMGPEGAAYADLFLASAAGLGSDVTSAYAAYLLPMPGLHDTPGTHLERHSFPGGNSGYARYFVKAVMPEAIDGESSFDDIITGKINFHVLDRERQPLRMRLGSTVTAVRHEREYNSTEHVDLVYVRAGEARTVRTKAVVMATGGWINKHVVRDLPHEYRDAYNKFVHAPFLVANVALTNWRFMEKLGITAAIWDKSEDDFGFTCNLRRPMLVGRHQPPLDPNRPAVLSFYTPFHQPGLPIRAQVSKGRSELMFTSYTDFERKIIRQMVKLFGAAGFDAKKDIAGIILNRWGHAYSVPYPGFYGGAAGVGPRDVIRKHYGRIAFAHSELDGLQHWGPAVDEGRRAVQQVLAVL